MDRADVVIVGGGIVGSAVAFFLAAELGFRGRVAIIERDTSYREGSTARSAGGVRQQFSTPENIAMSQFTVATFRRLEALFGADADVGFHEQGYLLLASAGGEALLSENAALQRSMGADIALLAPAGLTARFPWLAPDGVAAGSFGQSGEGWFDPSSLASLFRKAAVVAGAILVHDQVTSIDADECVRGVALASGARLACGSLVNAAGAWAGALSALADVPLPVAPRKRYVYVVDCREPPEALRRAPLVVDPSGVWFRPEGKVFLCGKSPETEDQEPPVGNLEEIDYAFFEDEIWPRLAHRVPVFESIKVVNAWAGYYDYNSLDQNAVIGAHPRLSNLYFAAGFSGHGAQQAAAAGRAIAELIVHGSYQSLDLARLGYGRIAANAPLPERNVI